MNPASPLKKLVILGGGSAGWMTAAALAKDLNGQCEIHLVESEAIGTVGVGEATIPPIIKFNHQLGIDEPSFLRETQGTFKLGIEFVGWGQKHSRYFHPFGSYGPQIGPIALHHHWLRARQQGETFCFSECSINWAMAQRGRMKNPAISGPLLQQSAYAYHFDAGRYAAMLRRFAERRGVVRHEGRVQQVIQHPETGFVQALQLEDGREITGDFFFDCSGQRALLIESTLNAGFEDWSAFLPCNRAVAVQSENAGEPLPYTRSTAQQAGWQWRIPLQHRTGNGYVYCTDFLNDDQACADLLQNLDGPAIGEPRVIPFVTGRRKKAWDKNVLAVGLSAGFLEPLESTSLHLIQTAIKRFRELMPYQDCDPCLVAEYNRQTEEEYRHIRDFLVLHYVANQRSDSAFWKACQALPKPDSLVRKMALFQACGRVSVEPQNLFKPPSWLAVYLGQNIIPARYDPRLDARSPVSASVDALAKLRQTLAAAADHKPTHGEILSALL